MNNLILKLRPTQGWTTLFFCFLFQMTMQSQIVWKGGTPGSENDWATCSNWSYESVPSSFDNVIIPNTGSSGAFYPVITESTGEISYLEVQSGASLTIKSSGDLMVNGASTFNYGVLNQGDITLDGKLSVINTALTPIINDGEITVSEDLLNNMVSEQDRINSFQNCKDLVSHCRWSDAGIALANYTSSYKSPSIDYNVALYNLGKTKMNAEDYTGALNTFKQLLAIEDITIEQKEETEFYQALLILNLDHELGERYMSQIAEDYAHNFQTDAEGIMSIK